jgi:lysyl endopeptidase
MASQSQFPVLPAPSLALAMLLLGGAAAAQQQMGPYTPPSNPAAESSRSAAMAAAPHLAQRFGVAPLAELAPAAVAAPAELARLSAWNAAGHLPVQNGFARSLPAAQRVHLAALPDAAAPGVAMRDGGVLARTSLSQVAWGGSVKVNGAYRLRLHLSAVVLPAGARLWVHGGGRTAGPFGSELIGPDGGLWTPSLAGDEMALDVEAPAAALAAGAGYGFTIDEALELVSAAAGSDGAEGAEQGLAGSTDTSCEVDASCYAGAFAGYAAARHAVAELNFLEGRRGFACTGQLLNDSASDGTPYLLTANHCISTQAVAATLEAFFDDYTDACNGVAPDLETLPNTTGATLLATATAAASSDFSLLRLASLPPGRTLLGWDFSSGATPNGTDLYRISHPATAAQKYSVAAADSFSALCAGFPLTHYIFSDILLGAAAPGSSGSAAMLANGQVVGQLYGGCGSNLADVCDPGTHPIDGAFAASYPALAPFLTPSPPKHCVPGGLNLCLDSKRFEVTVIWSNQFNGTSGAGHAIAGTDQAGYFYFTDASNYELIVKILDFGTVFKVFYGELTDLNFTMKIVDTASGTVKTYTNTAGNCGAIDEAAFPAGSSSGAAAGADSAGETAVVAPPGAEKGSCAPGSSTLCLLGRRFAVGMSWMNQFSGQSGAGAARSLSDLSGLFTFTDPSDVELVVKVVPFTNEISFYYGSLSNLEWEITVTDTTSGAVKTYSNPAGTYCGGLDADAFPP